METTRGFLFVMILSLVLCSVYCDDGTCNCSMEITRAAFPESFFFGAGSTSYQYEGAYDEDGKGQSNWDYYTHNYRGRILDLSNGDVATNSYHRYKEDVAIAKHLNLDYYRFSVSWPRILPYGKLKDARINQKGIDYYNNLIDEIIRQGMQPCVTIFHWDLPQALEEAYGGFLNDKIVEEFRFYAEVLFKNFGDRVKRWVTLNEPWSYAKIGYADGKLAPGRCSKWQRLGCLGGDSGTEPYWVSHNMLLAHAAAVNTYRQKYQDSQNGSIGITLCTHYFLPYDDASNDDHEAKQRGLDFNLGWHLHPITYGDYPQSMRYLLGSRLPDFTANDTALLKGSYDFLGLNYYTTSYLLNEPNPCCTPPSYLTDSQVNETSTSIDGIPLGEVAGGWINIYPKGLRGLLNYTKTNYKNPRIIITENGLCSEEAETLEQLLNDTKRVEYIKQHLCCIREAIYTDGVNVEGYIAWALLDNFEWMSGYTARYGLYYVDFNSPNLTRIPKISGDWYQSILAKPTQKHALPGIFDQ